MALLRLCPKCKKGRMRPINAVVDYSRVDRAEGLTSRDYQCDNDECKHKEINRGMYESH